LERHYRGTGRGGHEKGTERGKKEKVILKGARDEDDFIVGLGEMADHPTAAGGEER
jgi:hypothetical protein